MKNKLIYVLLSLAIAFGLWFYVITTVSPESDATFYNVPVVLNNQSILREKGLMIVSDKEPKVTLKLGGNRSDLNKLKSSDITLIADLSKINEAGEQSLSYTISYPGTFPQNSFSVLSRNPGRIQLDIAEWSTKDVDVHVNYTGSVPKDYIADEQNELLDHEKITVTGPKSVIDQITQARVDVNLDNRTQTFSESYRYTLCDRNGKPVDAEKVVTNVAEVNLTLRVLLVKEVQLKVDVINGGNIPQNNFSIKIFPGETIKVAGSDRILENLDAIHLGPIDLSEIVTDWEQFRFEIKLPEGVRNLSGVTNVNVKVSFEGLKTTEIMVSDITAQGTVPAGMSAKFPIQWKVILRGPVDEINAITADDVRITVDLTDAELGEDLYEAQVLIDRRYPGVEVVLVEDISVTLLDAHR